MSKLDRMVLVLNKGWAPIHIKPVKDAICDVVSGCARVLDHTDEFFTLHDWADWIALTPTDSEEKSETIQMVKGLIRMPHIIVLNAYNEVKQVDIKLTRRNVFLRDRYQCQYCGKKITMHTGTVDHVIPKSRGGKNSWENFATACKPCNAKKRNRTPQEAGVNLMSKPKKPKWYPLTTRLNHNSPESWNRFLDKSRMPEYLLS